VGFVEGTSALILFFVAMPLKYLSGMPEIGKPAVFWVGLIHGLLFISYATVTFIAWGKGSLTAKLVGLAAIASIVPFGPFAIDRRLKAYEEASQQDRTESAW
jgi:integral membrane protein